MNKILPTIATLMFVLAAVPAFAQTAGAAGNAAANIPAGGTGTGTSAKTDARLALGKSKADQEIERRITGLTALNTEVQAMIKVSSDIKSSIAATVSGEISNLTLFKAKIEADTDITNLKADIKSMMASYPIFRLVIPQGRIEVAADKIQTLADAYTAFAAKLQTRITNAQVAGKDVTAISASLTDMKAKIADAQMQARAAVSHVANLHPAGEVVATRKTNKDAIDLAHTDIRIALADIKTARQDAGNIVKALQGTGTSAGVTTTTPAGTP